MISQTYGLNGLRKVQGREWSVQLLDADVAVAQARAAKAAGASNLIAASGPAKPYTYDGYLAQFTFTEQEEGGFTATATAAEYTPTFITPLRGGQPARVHLIPDALAAGTPLAEEMQRSAERTRTVVYSLGAEGLTERG